MKKNLLLLLVMVFSISLFAQKKNNKFQTPKAKKERFANNPLQKDIVRFTSPQFIKKSSMLIAETSAEISIGATFYDLQTNTCVDNSRLVYTPDGKISAVWTMGHSNGSSNGYPARGTGYNHFDGSAWLHAQGEGLFTMPALEQDFDLEYRTGWPSMAVTNTTEFIFPHLAESRECDGLPYLRRDLDGGEWEQIILESGIYSNDDTGIDDMLDLLWPRATAGGADGNSIHLIAVTEYDEEEGHMYLEQDRTLVYYRSTDNGETWDDAKTFPLIADSTFRSFMSGDNYSISANGDHIAVAYFDKWYTTAVSISHDNGDTWETKIVAKFPVDPDVFFGMGDDSNGTLIDVDSDGVYDVIRTIDGVGNVLIDDNGKVHMFFGTSCVFDDDEEPGTYYYPTIDGLYYWNEDMGEPVLPPENYNPAEWVESEYFAKNFIEDRWLITVMDPSEYTPPQEGEAYIDTLTLREYWETVDPTNVVEDEDYFKLTSNAIPILFSEVDSIHFNGDTLITSANMRDTISAFAYGKSDEHSDYPGRSLIGMMTSGIDASGNIFLAYSATMDTSNVHSVTQMSHKHVFVASHNVNHADGVWSTPIDLTSENNFNFEEGVFPVIARHVDDKVRVMYLSSEHTSVGEGTHNDGDVYLVEQNLNKFVTVDVADFDNDIIVGINKPEADITKIDFYPNPIKDNFTIKFNVKEKSNINIKLNNIVGQNVMTLENANFKGSYNKTFSDIENLKNGVYFLEIKIGNETQTQKLIINK